MCGIAGLYSFEKFKDKHKIKKLATALLLDIESRGRHATGISLINTEKDEIIVYKKDVEAEIFVRTKKYHQIFKNNDDFNLILLHTRHATHGDAEQNVNNHPIYNKEFNNVLIHNGIISNYEELKEKYKLKPDGETDTEIILSLFNKKHQNIKDGLRYLKGDIATAVYNKNKLYLYKHNNPLKMCYNITEDLFLFSSHKDIFKTLFTEDENTIYNIFTHYREKDEYCLYDLEDDDLIKVFFKNKRIKKDTAEMDDTYNTTITWTQPTEDEKKQAIEDEKINIINENEETDEFLKNQYETDLIREYEDNYVDYLELLKDEDDNEQKEYNNIHRQPLNEKINDYNYNAYGRY